MATAPTDQRATTPFDVSEEALYVENRWHDHFARLRREMPDSYRGKVRLGPIGPSSHMIW